MTSVHAQGLRRPRENLGVNSSLAKISQSEVTSRPLAGLQTRALAEAAQTHVTLHVYLKAASLHHSSSPEPKASRVPSPFTLPAQSCALPSCRAPWLAFEAEVPVVP